MFKGSQKGLNKKPIEHMNSSNKELSACNEWVGTPKI
jgi:hypothetical protein